MPSLLFDARLVLEKPTGIGQYIASLVPEMLRLAPDWHIHLLRRAAPWPDYGLAGWQAPNLTQHVSVVPHMALRQQVDLPRLAQRLGADLLHYPHFDAPVLWQTVPVVATIHDAKYLVHPEFFPNLSRVKRRYMRFCFAQSLRRAAVITVSRYTAADLQRLFPRSVRSPTVVYEAANPRLQPATPAGIAALRQKYALARPLILTVGERRPHKNHVGLIRAYAASQSRQTHDLVIVGQAYQDYTEPEEVAAQLGLGQSVHFLTSVDDAELAACYSAAELFVLVSFYEGFGLPILEAMRCGAPVIAAATTAAGEIAGDAGITVDPHDTGAIAAALDAVLQQPAYREKLIRCGAQREQAFTWAAAADQTLTVYRQVLGRQGPTTHVAKPGQ